MLQTLVDIAHGPLAHVAPGPFEPIQPLIAALAVFAYGRRVQHLAGKGKRTPLARQVSYYGGVLLILAALYSPVGYLADKLLFMHMIEHLLLGDIATLLIVLGLTGPIIAPVMRIGFFARLRVLTNPLIALPLWAIDLYVWHLPVFYEAAVRHDLIHGLEHTAFIAFGINMWMPLFGPLPQPKWFTNIAKLGYILVVRLAGALLANVFIWSQTAFYPVYTSQERHWHISPLHDQGLGGGIMLLEGSLLTLVLFAWLFLRAAEQSEQSQRLLDEAQASGVALDPERAARAAASGSTAILRDRLAE
jgi:cytochrome c oxidase assembly factor CtaG